MTTKETEVTKEKRGLNIRFKVGKSTYVLRSTVYDFILEEIKTKIKDDKPEEYICPIGSGSTLYSLLRYLSSEYYLRNTEIKTLIELIREQEVIMKSLSEITNNVTIECFIKPEDKKSLANQIKKLEIKIERLTKENQSLRGKIRADK